MAAAGGVVSLDTIAQLDNLLIRSHPAIAYGYFEVLINLGDDYKFLVEETRLKSLANVVASTDYDFEFFNDFAEPVIDLLRKAREGLQNGTAETALHETFNDEALQNYIITYFRVRLCHWIEKALSLIILTGPYRRMDKDTRG
jgi:hypothetical protein